MILLDLGPARACVPIISAPAHLSAGLVVTAPTIAKESIQVVLFAGR